MNHDDKIVFRQTRSLIAYPSALQAMKKHVQSCLIDECWFLQHEPVYTVGSGSQWKSHWLSDPQIAITQTNRGGQVTYHGPGQLMIYLLLNPATFSHSVRVLLAYAHEMIQSILKDFQIQSHLVEGQPGVYVQGYKIASVGFRIQKKSYHGLSLNIQTNLNAFHAIEPCGDPNARVTHMADCTTDSLDFDTVVTCAKRHCIRILKKKHAIHAEQWP